MALQHLRPHQGPTVSYLHPTSLIIWLWNMGPNTSLIRQGWCFWHLPASYSLYTIRGSVANATVRLWAGSPPQLSQLIQRSRLQLFGHMARMDVSLDISRALKTSVRGLPVEWKRPLGRPRHTWLRILAADLQPHNHGLNSAWRCAQDREHRKHLVETATLQLGACAWWWWK